MNEKQIEVSLDRFKFWLHNSDEFIVYGVSVTWAGSQWLRGVVVKIKDANMHNLGDNVDEEVIFFTEIFTNEFPALKKRVAQALLWDDDLKRYVTSYAKFSTIVEVKERLDKPESSHLSLAQWPLVIDGKEMWKS